MHGCDQVMITELLNRDAFPSHVIFRLNNCSREVGKILFAQSYRILSMKPHAVSKVILEERSLRLRVVNTG